MLRINLSAGSNAFVPCRLRGHGLPCCWVMRQYWIVLCCAVLCCGVVWWLQGAGCQCKALDWLRCRCVHSLLALPMLLQGRYLHVPFCPVLCRLMRVADESGVLCLCRLAGEVSEVSEAAV